MWSIRALLCVIGIAAFSLLSWKIALPLMVVLVICFSLASMGGEQDVEQNTEDGPEYLRQIDV